MCVLISALLAGGTASVVTDDTQNIVILFPSYISTTLQDLLGWVVDALIHFRPDLLQVGQQKPTKPLRC